MGESIIFQDEECKSVNMIYKYLNNEYEKIQNQLYLLKELVLIPKRKYLKRKNYDLKPAKRGRKKKNSEIEINPVHSKFCYDNLLRKVKVMYHGFIVNFINDYIKKLFGIQKLRIRKILGKITQNISKQYNFEISKKSIKDFLSNQISKKYKRKNDMNKKNIEKLYFIKKEVRECLDISYLSFYKKYFLCDNRNSLEICYGISSKTLTLNDQLKVLSKKESKNYCKEFEIAAKNKFLLFLDLEEDNINKNNNNIFINEKEIEIQNTNIPIKQSFNINTQYNKFPIFKITKTIKNST